MDVMTAIGYQAVYGEDYEEAYCQRWPLRGRGCGGAGQGGVMEKPTMEQAGWVLERVAESLLERDTLRDLVYDRMGYGTGAYIPLWPPGLKIINYVAALEQQLMDVQQGLYDYALLLENLQGTESFDSLLDNLQHASSFASLVEKMRGASKDGCPPTCPGRGNDTVEWLIERGARRVAGEGVRTDQPWGPGSIGRLEITAEKCLKACPRSTLHPRV